MKKISSFITGKPGCSSTADTAGLYSVEERFGYNVYNFDEDFIHLVRYAMSTDCVSEMTSSQLALYTLFVEHMLNSTYTEETAELSDHLYRVTSCMPTQDGVTCGDSVNHTYTACP